MFMLLFCCWCCCRCYGHHNFYCYHRSFYTCKVPLLVTMHINNAQSCGEVPTTIDAPGKIISILSSALALSWFCFKDGSVKCYLWPLSMLVAMCINNALSCRWVPTDIVAPETTVNYFIISPCIVAILFEGHIYFLRYWSLLTLWGI